MHRLALVLAVWSCSSPSRPPVATRPALAPVTAAGVPAAAPQDAPQPPPANVDRFERGRTVERTIKTGEAHRYRIELAAGHAAIGVVMQKGIDLIVTVFDPSGRKLSEIDSPNGPSGPEPIVVEATAAGAYDVEVLPFVAPVAPGAAAPSGAAVEGQYSAQLDEVLTPEAYAEHKAKDRIGSATLLEAWRAVHAKDHAAVAKFWSERKDKGPIVEPYPGDPRDVLVTFVLRATTPYVGLIGGPEYREKPLLRLEDSDLWYLSARMPADSRFDYAFIVADGPPPSWLVFRKDRGPDERWFKKQRDPNNPLVHFDQSRLELPGAAPEPWIAAKPEVPKGKITELELESAQLKETRRVGVYTPPGHDPKRRYPLLIAFDGEDYGLDAGAQLPLPTILDNMIAAKKIPPIIAVLVASGSTRSRDLPGSAPFSAFIANELVPKLRADYRAGMTPAETIVTGSSFGGLCSAYTALHHSGVVGNVLSQSGSFQYVPGSLDEDVSPFVEGGWLIRDYAAAPKRPIRFYLDAGRFEANLLDSNRHMRDVLVAKGYPVTYAEFSGGHDYWLWRATISDGLIALLAKKS